MTSLYFCSLFIILFTQTIHATNGIYPHILRQTNISCLKTDDCLAFYNHSWCHSGLTCIRSVCYSLPAYPCDHTEYCDEKKHECIKQSCRSSADCNDHLFCNGDESCVNFVCRPDYNTGCFHGICSEMNKTCSTPISLQEEKNEFNQYVYLGKKYIVENTQINILHHPHNGTSNHTHGNHDDELNTSVNFAIICAVSVVVVVILILLIIAIVSR